MIIEAKSSQQQHQKSDPADLRKKLEFNVPEKTSRLPVYLALFFTGIAAYVKSVFPADAQDHVSPGTEANPAANSGAPRGTRHEPGGPGVDLMTTGGIEEEHPRSSVRHAALGWDEAFTMPDPIAFHYTAASFDFLGPNVAPFFPAAVHYRPQNDNAALFDRAEPNITPSSSGPKPHQDTPSPSEDDGDNDNADPDDDDEDDDDDNGTNRAPTVLGPVRLHDVFAGQVVLIGLSQLLFGASDPDNDILTINDLTVTGATLVQTGAGWTLTTLPGMLGLVTFTYEISDGLIEIVQTASLEIVRNQVHLTANADVYAGTPWDDDIDALPGHDIIDARAGNDSVTGGLGDDHIIGGDGDDTLFGNEGNDIIFGGEGNDTIGGGAGNDLLFGEAGNDIIHGDEGNDTIEGGAGDDIIHGGEGDDVIEGNEGNDTVAAGAGNDTAKGGEGDDVIHGDEGDDTIEGNEGDDILDGDEGDDIIAPGTGNDRVDGGEGHDTLDYSTFTADIHLDFEAGTALSEEIGEDLFESIEEIIGGEGNDTFVFGATAAIVAGGEGHDLFIFAVADERPTLSHQIVFGILDFVVGDRIHVAQYEISRRAERLEEERFGDVYDAIDDGFEAGLPIRVTYATYDDIDHTIIEADVDRNDFYEISITLDGVHLPLAIGNQVA
ncbi:cadherin-like domain-containing protein [Devosia sp.]|uniref:calcium-binding protein n=1 Tax=Devosia sp. TaxID=1871048 RepID=UPI0025D88212|nr:cadherin-like domain-containing protein [Devosia sp.]MCR6636557.1 cadherin-like domain-containing protein [Devosia sp.]